MAVFDKKDPVAPVAIGTIIYTIKDHTHETDLYPEARSLTVRAELLDANGKIIDSVRGDIGPAIPADERAWLIAWMDTMRQRFHNRVIVGE